jgi:hypothetical protein
MHHTDVWWLEADAQLLLSLLGYRSSGYPAAVALFPWSIVSILIGSDSS